MRRRRRFPPDDPREWLNRARSDLAIAKADVPEAYLEELCFHTQQAAEKAIKGLLIMHGVEFPYVHDLGYLLTLIEDAGETIPQNVEKARSLTVFATGFRYPFGGQPVTEQDHYEAVSIAEAVVRWAEERVEAGL